MTPNFQAPRLRLVHLLWLVAVLLSVYVIEKNELYKIFLRGEKYVFAQEVRGVLVSVSVPHKSGEPGVAPDKRYRVVKLSFPFGTLAPSCDQLFGVAVYNYAATGSPVARRRLLFSFNYDIPNGRCESKQLYIDDLSAPDSIDLQFVSLVSSDEVLVENPQDAGIHIQLNNQAFDPHTARVEQRAVNPAFPFLSHRVTRSNPTFSTDTSPRDVNILVSPDDDIGGALNQTLENFVAQCPGGKGCGPLLAAVARIDDARFAELFTQARTKGIDTEVIISFRPWIQASDLFGQQALNQLQPLEWLVNNPYVPYRPELHLPMHTKFIVVGDRLVLSGTNLYFGRFPDSRQNLIRYSDPRIISMFREVFARIETNAFAPKRVDLSRGFSLMLGGEKMQRIGALRRKVSPGVITEDGLRTTAYAVALHLIDDAQRSLTVSMTPLSDACHQYDSRLCFFDILAKKAKSIRTTFYENPYFFLDSNARSKLSQEFLPGGMSLSLIPEAQTYAQQIGLSPLEMEFRKLSFGVGGTYHHRLAIVDGETIIGGSVNLAHALSLNTVEVIRSDALAKQIEQKMRPREEPYYIVPIWSPLTEVEMRQFERDRNCLFVYEYPGFRAPHKYSLKEFTESEVRDAARKQYPGVTIPATATLRVPELELGAAPRPPAQIQLSSRTLSGTVRSFSSDLCIAIPGRDEHLIVRVRTASF